MSHDRYFINKTATRILDLTGHTLVNYIGNYDYYLEKKELMTELYASEPAGNQDFGDRGGASQTSESSEVKQDWKAFKEEQARIRKRQNDLKKPRIEIHQLETRDSNIDGYSLRRKSSPMFPASWN